ncbi:MAG: class I SAM-dependent methyltransferase [Phycisphaerales bacterium]
MTTEQQTLEQQTDSTLDSTESVHQSEAAFHDEWAESTPVEDINVFEAFESPTAPENKFMIEKMGDLKGKTLLDIGAGLGESSVYFALKGAKVTTSDISQGMVNKAIELGKHHGVELEGLVAAGETIDVEEGTFDIVYIANTIHHVTDKRAMYEQVLRALKPGGRVFTWDPLAYNPVINVYRKMAMDVRTEDEEPLTFKDVDLLGEYFENVEHREFWIASLAIFLKYYLIDSVKPNDDRYWKRIFKEDPKKLWWWKPLERLDRVLGRVPLVRRMAWNMVMIGQKPVK